MSDEKTIDVYTARASEYADMTDAENTADPRLESFISLLPKTAFVLDLGCGPGASAARMARAGLQVDATDASPKMVEMARRHKGVNALQSTFDDIEGDAIYDGIWANFSLLHAPRSDLPRHLAALHCALKPEGRFHIAVKLGRGEHRDKLGRLYTYYTQSELTHLLILAGFTVTQVDLGSGSGLDGTPSDWVSLAAHG